MSKNKLQLIFLISILRLFNDNSVSEMTRDFKKITDLSLLRQFTEVAWKCQISLKHSLFYLSFKDSFGTCSVINFRNFFNFFFMTTKLRNYNPFSIHSKCIWSMFAAAFLSLHLFYFYFLPLQLNFSNFALNFLFYAFAIIKEHFLQVQSSREIIAIVNKTLWRVVAS